MDETREDLDKKFFGGCSLEAYKKGVAGKFHGLPMERYVSVLNLVHICN